MQDEVRIADKIMQLNSGGWQLKIEGDAHGDWFIMECKALDLRSLPLGSLDACEAYKSGANAVAAKT